MIMKPCATLVLLVLVAAVGVCCVTAQNASGSFELYYIECTNYSPPSIFFPYNALGTTSIGPDGQNRLLATFYFQTYNMITSGSYNIIATGNDDPDTTGTLDSIFTPQLPYAPGDQGVASLSLSVFEGQNTFNMTATDQSGREITCFSFSYQMQKSIDKNIDTARQQKERIRTAASPRHSVTNTQSSRRRRRTASLTRAHL